MPVLVVAVVVELVTVSSETNEWKCGEAARFFVGDDRRGSLPGCRSGRSNLRSKSAMQRSFALHQVKASLL